MDIFLDSPFFFFVAATNQRGNVGLSWFVNIWLTYPLEVQRPLKKTGFHPKTIFEVRKFYIPGTPNNQFLMDVW